MSAILDPSYFSIASPNEGIYTDKGSKFIAIAIPIADEAEVKIRLEEIKKKHPKARHFCYAYQFGVTNISYRINDDGEPSGTAGKPIYGQIRSHELNDILVVVVRYFGGTLLGTGGLINAYKTAAATALESAQKIRKTPTKILIIEFEFSLLNEVMKIVKQKKVEILSKTIAAKCKMELRTSLQMEDEIRKQMLAINGLSILE